MKILTVAITLYYQVSKLQSEDRKQGTSGSPGISLSTLSAQKDHSVIIVMPDDQ